ncbi:MAG: hypothetical protein KUG75_00180 [Pseudomonadales bacterium]|nr:hypothetical protein [Pseudomonadales bacterium]
MSIEERSINFQGKDIVLRLSLSDGLSLWVEGCLRKQRSFADQIYLWTNVELDWEQHRYLEVYYQAETGNLKLTANGSTILEDKVLLTQ